MTKRSQRVGIWVIAIVMAVGSIGLYFVAVLANQNGAKDTAEQQKAYTEYQAAVEKQANELSDKYYPTFSQYAGQVGAFDASAVTELQSNDLLEGDGEVVGEKTSYAAYYIGWNPTGKIFDQSIADGKLKTPLAVTGNTGLIEGWNKGVVGMKLGGVRELTIPAAQAYGAQSPSADIPANTPLKFLVMVIPVQTAVPVPASLQQQ